MIHRVSRALVALIVLVAAVPAVAEPPDKPKPRIEDLSARIEGDRAEVSYRLAGVLTPEIEERIQSGIAVSFKHRVDVKVKRGFPVLVDRLIARTLIDTRVQYDTLTQRYVLLRSVEQRTQKKSQRPPTDEQRRVTDSAEEVREWMETIDQVPVFDPSREFGSEKLWVRAEVNLGRSYFLWVFPTTDTVSEEIALEP